MAASATDVRVRRSEVRLPGEGTRRESPRRRPRYDAPVFPDSKHPAPKRLRFEGSPGSAPKIRTNGQQQSLLDDLYHRVLSMPWWRFFASVTAIWLGANFVFAVLYATSPGCVANASTFEEDFYFSVQTFATIGYGGMYPATRYGHLVVVVEALIGTLGMALILGVTFAKFARATARVIFSHKAVVHLRDGSPYLVFRMANWRGNMVVEGQLRVFVLLMETSREGDVIRIPHEISLVRDRTALFALTWVPMHRIDPSSPFWGGQDAIDRLRRQDASIYMAFTGLDETIGQPIHARHVYRLDDIVWNARHANVLTVEPDGTRIVDYAPFHDVEVLGEASDIPWAAQ
jgi:inward rectifier potassium channel